MSEILEKPAISTVDKIVSHKILDGNVVVVTADKQTYTITKQDFDEAKAEDKDAGLKIINGIPLRFDSARNMLSVGVGKIPPVVVSPEFCPTCGQRIE